MNWGEVNPTHAYYNGSRTSKDNEDPGWNTSFKTRRTQKTTSAVEALWKTILRCYLYLLGTLLLEKDSIQSLDQVSGFQMKLKTLVVQWSLKRPEPELIQSKRNMAPNNFGPEFQLYLIEGTRDEYVCSLGKEAIIDEMDSIHGQQHLGVLADLPSRFANLLVQIFKRKLKVDGTIEKFKARLVIQGFKQMSEIDYFDTYAPVVHISTIRLLILMVSIHNLIIHQMDVKTAFLNGDLDEEVDLKREFLLSMFSMKNMGEADVILSIRIKHKSNGIAISQSHYIKNLLKKFNYFDCTPVSTLMDLPMPDIAFTMGKLSRYTSNPSTQHWQASQRVLKYLKKTMDYRLTYTGYPSVLEGYTDASWISNTEDNSSTSGWVFLLGGGAISWASKKQTCITGLTMERFHYGPNLWQPSLSVVCVIGSATLVKAYSQMYNGKS
ncbi:zinc finger, CCHC-type containing protein [Tanacetum coccineum]